MAVTALVIAAGAFLEATVGRGIHPPRAAVAVAPAAVSPAPPAARPTPVARVASLPGPRRAEGLSGAIPWIDVPANAAASCWHLSQPGSWNSTGEAITGDDHGSGAVAWWGEPTWRDYEVEVRLRIERGGNAIVRIRSPDGRHGYLIDCLFGLQAISLRRCDGGSVRILSQVDADLSQEVPHVLRVSVHGDALATWWDGALCNQVTDGTWPHGQAGIGVWQSRVRFDAIRVRLDDGSIFTPHIPSAAASHGQGF